MLKVKCLVCGKILPMKDTSKRTTRILCADCYEKLTLTQEAVASEFTYQTDQLSCGRCGA